MNILQTLKEMSSPPSAPAAFAAWLELKDVVPFLVSVAQADDFVVYAGFPSIFLHAVLVPAARVTPPDVADLLAWNFNASGSWGIVSTFSEPPTVSISPPLQDSGGNIFDSGEQLVFARSFEGRLGEKDYFEALQKFVHLFDLHFLAERNAYCRLDNRGDIEEVIRIAQTRGDEGALFASTVITFKRALLDQYMVLSDSVLVQTFDFSRFRPASFSAWPQISASQVTVERDCYYRSSISAGHASYMRGVQLVRPGISKAAIVKQYTQLGQEETREYASFIAHDFKNRVVKEISTAPGQSSSYFETSGLPFETSPVFFRPDVLLRYKADSEKYQLGDRSISCRGAWHLQTYDVNEAGQVHTYLCYLRSLPYEEQLYWKAHNEHPKGPISKRAQKADFEGSWDFEHDPLDSLRETLRELYSSGVSWWTLREAKLLDQVHYPITASADEWSNELHQLDKLVVEGFDKAALRKRAQSLGRTPGVQLGSLKLVEECLIGLGFEEENARAVTAPLHLVHDLRSKLKAHASGRAGEEAKRSAIAEHGSYKEHFRVLCGNCDEAVRTIVEALAK